jgi:hypothetical protein
MSTTEKLIKARIALRFGGLLPKRTIAQDFTFEIGVIGSPSVPQGQPTSTSRFNNPGTCTAKCWLETYRPLWAHIGRAWRSSTPLQ